MASDLEGEDTASRLLAKEVMRAERRSTGPWESGAVPKPHLEPLGEAMFALSFKVSRSLQARDQSREPTRGGAARAGVCEVVRGVWGGQGQLCLTHQPPGNLRAFSRGFSTG